MKPAPKHSASVSPSSSSSASSPGSPSAASSRTRATTSPSPSCRAWATRRIRGICASRETSPPVHRAQRHARAVRAARAGQAAAGTVCRHGAATRHLQGQRAGPRHRHLWPRWRLPCHRAAGQVRVQVCAGTEARQQLPMAHLLLLLRTRPPRCARPLPPAPTDSLAILRGAYASRHCHSAGRVQALWTLRRAAPCERHAGARALLPAAGRERRGQIHAAARARRAAAAHAGHGARARPAARRRARRASAT